MAIVKVWNDNEFPHKERFKGEELVIPAGGFIMMDYIDAIDFRGQFITPKMRGPNDPDPTCFKKIRVEEPLEPVIKEDPNVFHATGKSMGSMAEILEFAKAYAAANPALVAKDESLDKAGPSNSELQAQIAELRALLESQARSKPGPKPAQRA